MTYYLRKRLPSARVFALRFSPAPGSRWAHLAAGLANREYPLPGISSPWPLDAAVAAMSALRKTILVLNSLLRSDANYPRTADIHPRRQHRRPSTRCAGETPAHVRPATWPGQWPRLLP